LKRITAIFLLLILLCAGISWAETNPIDVCTNPGSGGRVHVDTLFFADGLQGYKFWLWYTPLPGNADTTYEHPNLCRSNDGETWVNTGVTTNPVLNGRTTYDWRFDADPDIICVDQYDRCFMIMGPRTNTQTGYVAAEREEELVFAYSDNDRTTWHWYDGTAVNGNTNPIVLSGNAGRDTGAASWEAVGGLSRTQYPSMIFDKSNSTFYFWYGNSDSANAGAMGCGSFKWSEAGQDITDFARCADNATDRWNPALTGYSTGSGHHYVVKDGSTYYLYSLRVRSSDGKYQMFRCQTTTPQDNSSWGTCSAIITSGMNGAAADDHMYRGGPIHDGEGNVVTLKGATQIIYSTLNTSNAGQLRVNNVTDYGSLPNRPEMIGGTFTGFNK
jgi:hypothetical protein